ncbi:DUF2599 domain-containing protein [Gordonia sp. NPDC003425]
MTSRRRLGATALAIAVCAATAAGCSSSDNTSSDNTASPAGSTGTSSPQTRSAVVTAPSPAVVSPPIPFVDPFHRPPYIDHVTWVDTAVGPSLQIYPTPSGRASTSYDGASVAWSEVLALAPRANTPGMQAQFDCHWDFARAVEPDKPSWNIEPGRPVVDRQQMIATRCNPGGPEE